MNKYFQNDWEFDNELWKIYNVDNDDSLKFFNMSNKNNVNEQELNLPNTEVNNCNYMNLSNKIIYSMLKDNNDNLSFLNVLDNKFYNVYNIFFNYKDSAIILYYCNENDPFIVVQSSVYMDFQYIFYPSKKEIICISSSTAYSTYYFIEILKTIKFVENNYNSNTDAHINTFKKYLFFGFNVNCGHHLWNEVSGLFYFLQNNNYHDKIDGIIFGPYDAFNLQKILKNEYNFKILKFTDLFEQCRHGHFKNLTNIFPIFLNSFYIDNNVRFLINSYFFKKEFLEISIDIRTNRRQLIDQDIFYTKLIKQIINDYQLYQIKINFLGCFQTNCNIIENNYTEFIEQNEIVNKIIQNFDGNNNIIFNNYIGENFSTIKDKVIKSKIFISSAGTSISNLLNWIYNTKHIYFGPIESYNWLFQQYNILQNYDLIQVPKEYIKTKNGIQGPFDIDFDLFYAFFKKQLGGLL